MTRLEWGRGLLSKERVNIKYLVPVRVPVATSSISRSPVLKNMLFARFQYFRPKSWYITTGTENLLPTKEACPERIHFRLQDATEVELVELR
jgi:hypothetical protein